MKPDRVRACAVDAENSVADGGECEERGEGQAEEEVAKGVAAPTTRVYREGTREGVFQEELLNKRSRSSREGVFTKEGPLHENTDNPASSVVRGGGGSGGGGGGGGAGARSSRVAGTEPKPLSLKRTLKPEPKP